MKVIEFESINGNRILPSKIKEARTARSLSMSQLSNLIGVSSQAISQYEKGSSVPSSTVLLKIINVLNFPTNFFLNDSCNDISKDIVYFRANKNITKKLQEACKIRIKWISDTYKMLNCYFDLPAVDIPYINNTDIECLDKSTIEDIAISLRKYWDLGDLPINNLLDILQEKGFVITRVEIGSKKIDAFSTWKDNIPYIFLGNDKSSAVRSRFDLAHELGHLILHRYVDWEELNEENKILENQADMFAAAFLLPLERFNRELISSSIDSFILLKKKWKVSIAAMIRRCKETDILTDNQIRYLKSQMIKYGYYKKEPMDDIIPMERPYLFKQAFEMLIDNKIMTKEQLLENLNLNKEDIISLYSLSEGFFEKSNNILRLVK